jgi:hypothetical protein
MIPATPGPKIPENGPEPGISNLAGNQDFLF